MKIVYGADLSGGTRFLSFTEYLHSNRFYYVSDALLSKQAALEAHLRAQQARHFHYARTILLYDLTNTHFEGEALGNAKAKRGKNKQGVAARAFPWTLGADVSLLEG